MSTFLALQKNLARRTRAAWTEYAVYILLIVAVAQLAIFVALPAEGRLRVAVVNGSTANPLAGVPGLSVTFPRRVPDRTDLAMGRIDAAVQVGDDGVSTVLFARSPAVADRLSALLQRHTEAAEAAKAADVTKAAVSATAAAPPARDDSVRGPASTLMGIWVMFLLIVGVLCGRFFIQDRERRILARMGATPLRAGTYLAANGLFTFALCFVPPLLMVAIEGLFLHGGLGLSVPGWALVLGCTAALAAAFALFVDTLLPDEDQAVNVASMTMLFTSLLSGSFIAPQAQGRLLHAVSTILPQRAIMELTARLEAGSGVGSTALAAGSTTIAAGAGGAAVRASLAAPLLLVIAEAAVFFLVAYAVTASRLRRGKG